MNVKWYRRDDYEYRIREASLEDIDRGLLGVFIEKSGVVSKADDDVVYVY